MQPRNTPGQPSGGTPGSGPPPPAGFGHPATGGLGSGLQPSISPQDLSDDKLLGAAPRVTLPGWGQPTPSLGGIPLISKLGQGGMGAVYYGIHPRLEIEVAVKVLPFMIAAQQPEAVQRFFREAKVAARVASPHLVGVKDVDQEAGLHFIVMEFVRGESAGEYLQRLIDAGLPGLPEADALEICIAAARGLEVAHAAGVVHRDMKPDNIMIPRSRSSEVLDFARAKVADLGLARGEDIDKSLTGSMASMGTPGYLAPEQGMDAKNAGPPADVFSMGATLYALLSGKAPFAGASVMKILMDTAYEAHKPIREKRADVSEAVGALIDRCLIKDPQGRFADGSALLAALESCRSAQRAPSALQAAPPSMTVHRPPSSQPQAVQSAPAPVPQPPLPSAQPAQVVPARPQSPMPVSHPQPASPPSAPAQPAAVASSSSQPPPPSQPPRRSSSGTWLGLVAVGLVLIVAAAGFFVWKYAIPTIPETPGIYVKQELAPGTRLEREELVIVPLGNADAEDVQRPYLWENIANAKLARRVAAGEPLTWDDIAAEPIK